MAKITKITIETDLYHREYKFSVDGIVMPPVCQGRHYVEAVKK